MLTNDRIRLDSSPQFIARSRLMLPVGIRGRPLKIGVSQVDAALSLPQPGLLLLLNMESYDELLAVL